MNELLNQRLNDLGHLLETKEDCCALLALGSCAELERMDEYSDLDFFVIVKEGQQKSYLNDLSWLSDLAPLVYVFRNSPDGHKVMWNDGIYSEYAVFEESQMNQVSFNTGRFIFNKQPDKLFSHPLVAPKSLHQSVDFAINEILTNLYVGLSRYHRGEKMAAFRLIQVHAIDRFLAMIDDIEAPKTNNEDPFGLERRIEQRHPELIEFFHQSMQGYDKSVEVAQYILSYLHTLTILNTEMTRQIIKLIQKQK